jgi:NAD(P)-dependent dehydrogenase (short-subunit alcohol dehydrogenase family)
MDIDAFERMIVGEVVNTTYLSARVLEVSPASPVTIVNVGSAAADFVPPAPIGSGGFAFSYAADKAALHRLAPFLQLEYGSRVRAFTLNPGTVRTERLLERLGDIPGAAPPSMPAAVIRWLALDPAADAHLGAYLHASKLAAEFGLA